MRLTNPSISGNPDIVNIINDIFDTFFGNCPGHTFSLLYNAYTESGFGERLKPYRNHIHNIHADSGGLQMVTLGKTITEELKDKVYDNQAEYADIGMCFDEIPVITTGSSDRNDTSNRYFDRDNRHVYAEATGQNLKKQIEVFKQQNSPCRPFMICQGGDLQTYLEWIDTILNIVPEEDHKNIGGVAMGGAALGTGPLEDIQKAFFASQVPVRDENGKLHLHILGVGSVTRLIPYLIFLQNGLYGDVHVSYDSTTHSRAVETGLYFIHGNITPQGKFVEGPGRTHKFSRTLTHDYSVLLENIKSFYDIGMDVNVFHSVMNTPSMKWLEENGNLDVWIKGRTAAVCGSIRNFMIEVERYMNDPEELKALALKKYPGLSGEQLFDVKDVESFRKWYDTWSPIYQAEKKSKSISHVAPENVSGELPF